MPYTDELRAAFARHGIFPEVIAADVQPGQDVVIGGKTVTVVEVKDAPSTVQANTDWTHTLVVRSGSDRKGVVSYRPDNGEVGKIGWLPER